MGGQAPRGVGLEEVVLQHEVLRVGPVVRDLPCVVVAHHVGCVRRERATRRVDVLDALEVVRPARLADEAVHLAGAHVVHLVEVVVRPAAVAVARVVERAHTAVQGRVGHAHRRHTVSHRNPVRARVRPEVGVEGAVLLHDHDHVPDLVDPLRRRERGLHGAGARARAADQRRRHDRCDRRRGEPRQHDPLHAAEASRAIVQRGLSLGSRSAASGSSIRKVAPSPSAERAETSPPWARAIAATIERPSPTPPLARVRDASAR